MTVITHSINFTKTAIDTILDFKEIYFPNVSKSAIVRRLCLYAIDELKKLNDPIKIFEVVNKFAKNKT